MNALVPTLTGPEPLSGDWLPKDAGVMVTGVCIPPSAEDFAYAGGPEYFRFGNPGFMKRRASEFERFGVEEIFAPNVRNSTREILIPSQLSTTVWVTPQIPMHSNPDKPGDLIAFNLDELLRMRILFRGKRYAYYARTRGCVTIVMSAGGHFLIGHLNRLNAIDHRLINNHKAYAHEGIMHAAAKYFDRAGVPRDQVQICIFGSINPLGFSHPRSHPKAEFHKHLFKRVKALGYSSDVMAPVSGNFSLEHYVIETAKMLEFETEVANLFTLPLEGDFPTTRDPRPLYNKTNNTSLGIFTLI